MVTTPSEGATVDEIVVKVLQEANLSHWLQQLVFGTQIRRLEHFRRHAEKEYRELGLNVDELRRLRTAVMAAWAKQQDGRQIYIKKEVSITTSTTSSQAPITIEQIKLMEQIGEGTFAIVKRGIWRPPDGKKLDVAVKILRDVSPLVMEDLQVEAGHLLNLQHPHLIRLYGVVQFPAMMVFELCEGGALLDRLRNQPTPLVSSLLEYCQQIVKAMCYLESRHCVHRDLAARNILLSKDEKVVKICDFGLMRNLKENEQMYIMGPQKRVPFAWCPPEALRHRKFSHASDVWAFGVTVWEIFSLGEDPWIGCRAIDVLKRIDAGERLDRPQQCSQQIFEIITLCWNVNPDFRPKFTKLKNFLQQVHFNVAQVREACTKPSEGGLLMNAGDKITVIENQGVTWFGQNERSRQFGSFLRSSVFVGGSAAVVVPPQSSTTTPSRPAPPPTTVDIGGNSRISLPIKGSLIHTGHADVRGGNTWGRPDAIDNIYLKNPVLGAPMEPGIPLMVPTVAETIPISPHRAAPPPPSSLSMKPPADPLKVDWSDFDRAQTPSFSPSSIEIPNFGTTQTLLNRTESQRTQPTPMPHQTPPRPSTSQTTNYPVVPEHRHNHPHNVIFPTATGVGSVSIPSSGSRAKPFDRDRPLQNLQEPVPKPSQPVAPTWTSQPRPSPNTTVPIIRPMEYNKKISTLTPTPAPAFVPNVPTTSKTTGFDPSVMSELNNRLQRQNITTFQPPSRKPLTAAQPTIVVNENGLSLGDPFIVPNSVKNVTEAPRYNEILERRMENVNLRQAPDSVRPHSTLGLSRVTPSISPLPINAGVLQPTPMPFERPKAAPAPSPVPPVPSLHQPMPISSIANINNPQPVRQTATPPIAPVPTTISAAATVKPLTVNLPPVTTTAPSSSQVTPKPTTTISNPTPSSTSAPVMRPTQPQTAPSRPVSALPTTSTQSAQSDALNRRSVIEEQVASLLPAPSALFYGQPSTSDRSEINVRSLPKASSTSVLPQTSLAAGIPTSSDPLLARPTSTTRPPSTAKPADPLPISMSSVLQPTVIPVNYPSPVVPAPERKEVNIASILNAYNAPPFNPMLQPVNQMGQVPLFAIGGGAPMRMLPPPQPMFSMPPMTCRQAEAAAPAFTIGDDEDIIEALDPMRSQRASVPATSTQNGSSSNGTGGISRAEQMEALYKEAAFVDPSRCDAMVKQCNGDIEVALRELKMNYLVDSFIAQDKGRAYSALDSNGWDLNRAAEALFN